jgi:hypothetical protein
MVIDTSYFANPTLSDLRSLEIPTGAWEICTKYEDGIYDTRLESMKVNYENLRTDYENSQEDLQKQKDAKIYWILGFCFVALMFIVLGGVALSKIDDLKKEKKEMKAKYAVS